MKRATAFRVPERGQHAADGFSLLEVVVAFAILSLTLGVLIQIFSRAMHTAALSGAYSRAATLAEAQLQRVGLEIPLEVGMHQGEPEEGLVWQLSIEEYVLDDRFPWEPSLQPYQVISRVTWETAEGQRELSLSTLRLGDLP